MINTLYTNAKLSQFKFKLPSELIASKPPKQRDMARLMVLDRNTKAIEHKLFKDILDYMDEDDLMVLNNTKVFPARLRGQKEKTGAQITVVLLRELNTETFLWDVIVDPARKIRIGNKLYFGDDEALVAEVIDNTTSRGRAIRFLYDGSHDDLIKALKGIGMAPLPDEILKMRDVTNTDLTEYQSLFAKVEGSVAAPTTSLHFSRELLTRMEIKGVRTTELTVHCGIGSFQTIDVEDLSKHRQDSEEMHIGSKCCDDINRAIAQGRRILAVGTSVLRALETAETIPGKVAPFDGWNNRFIFPPHDFTINNMLVANLQHPMSPQFILVSSFGGPELTMEAYKLAVKEKYKFGTYGDALLIK